jgi:hypothetical protein
MRPSFFECFERRRLSERQTWLNAAFRENPASLMGAHQQEFKLAILHAVTDRRHLFSASGFPHAGLPR